MAAVGTLAYESRLEYRIRYLERLPLQVRYQDVVHAVDVLQVGR
jgi:hypothetical protein